MEGDGEVLELSDFLNIDGDMALFFKLDLFTAF